MADRVTILVGTMTGTAELVADAARDALVAAGITVEIRLMDGLGVEALADVGTLLVCTSTYGQGDVPDNARALFGALDREAPDLSALRHGVIALGDMTYAATFCHGGKRFDALLQRLGSQRVGEPFLHDASSGTLPEDEAGAWATTWADTLAHHVPAGIGAAAAD